MSFIDWDDVNVLRKLSDGWYSVPSDSKYGKMISEDSEIKYNDSVNKAKKRHEIVLRKEREIDDFIKTEKLRDKPCDHKNYSYKGYLICAECGLMEKNFDPYAFNKGDEDRVHITKKKDENDTIVRLCFKAMTVIEKFIDALDGAGGDIPTLDILDVFETYVLISDDRGGHRFRISARLEGLCAALLWRNLQIRKKPMTMLEFSKKIKMDRMTVSQIVKRLDDYENFKLNKRGRPKRK